MTTVLIAEDHQIFNYGLKALLSDDFLIIGQVFNGKEVIPSVQKYTPDILVLDINMPLKNGLDIGKELKTSYPKIKLFYLSMYSELSFLKTAKELGADGYFLKDSAGSEIVAALKKFGLGQKIFDPKLEETPINLHHEDYFVKNFSLSKREVEIIRLLKQNKSTEEIAKQLFLSFETIKSHRKNIYLKLSINKISELINFANANEL